MPNVSTILAGRTVTMDYHLYERLVNNQKIYYFHYIDETGKRIRKSTGCTKKADAKAFLSRLELLEEQKRKDAGRTLFGTYAANFFDAKSPILDRWAKHGRILKDRTLVSHRAFLRHYLLPWFAESYIDTITAKDLDMHLLEARSVGRNDTPKRPLTGSTKNAIRDTLMIIMREALFDGLIPSLPAFVTYARNSRRQNTLTEQELQALFPFSPDEFGKVWETESDAGDPIPGRCFATLSAIAVSCGLRSGETLALSTDQIVSGKGLIIDRSLDEKGNVDLVKKGTAADPRIRVVPMSVYTLSILNRWIECRGDSPGLLFTYRGHRISAGYLLKRFQIALDNAGIDLTNRRITFHGLRYTYNTRMKNAIPREMLRDIIGHKNDSMTDHYDRPVLEERLDEYRDKLLSAVNGFWKM